MLKTIYTAQQQSANKALDALRRNFGTLRTGKVNAAILDNVSVDYYGTPTPINQVATVMTTDAVTIAITPWERSMLKAITAAIAGANLGVNPNNDGECVKLFFPPMTLEERQKSAKEAKVMGDNAKVAVRNGRKSANDEVKKLEKDKAVSEDEAQKAYDEVQKITDEFIAKIDEMVKNKEAELLKI